MAEDRPVTPEKQLLKLIEDPQSASGRRPAARASSARSLAGLRGMLAGRLSFWKRSARGRKSSKGLDLALVNRALALVTVALLGYVCFDAAASVVMLSRPPQVTIAPARKASDAPATQNVSPLKESAFYLEKVSSRDIFKEGARPAPTQAQEAVEPEVEDVSDQFSLVGISWSSDPDVIIENKAEQRTYFVKRGQPVGSGAKVEAVFKDRVILSREGREFELR